MLTNRDAELAIFAYLVIKWLIFSIQIPFDSDSGPYYHNKMGPKIFYIKDDEGAIILNIFGINTDNESKKTIGSQTWG